MRERDGCTWVYLADEFYLNAGVELPPAEHYDGFPQYENGIGLVRDFLDDVRRSQRPSSPPRSPRLPRRVPVTLVTGDALRAGARGAARAARPAHAESRFSACETTSSAATSSVAGLLTASDLLARARRARRRAAWSCVPDCIANADGLLLDDVAVAELGTALR